MGPAPIIEFKYLIVIGIITIYQKLANKANIYNHKKGQRQKPYGECGECGKKLRAKEATVATSQVTVDKQEKDTVTG